MDRSTHSVVNIFRMHISCVYFECYFQAKGEPPCCCSRGNRSGRPAKTIGIPKEIVGRDRAPNFYILYDIIIYQSVEMQ